MASLEELNGKLDAIQTEKDNIKEALNENGANANDDLTTYADAVRSIASVKTVNNVEADENKNVQLDASNINIDDTAETKQTIKEVINTLQDNISSIEIPNCKKNKPIDDLSSFEVDIPLSANQGRVLNEKIESVSGSMGTGIAPGDVTNIVVKERNTKLIVSWTDPENVVVSGATLSEWKGTKLIIKEGSPATSVSDGTLVIDSQVRNQYSTNGYTIEGLKNDTQYYVSLFPYNTTNASNTNEANTVTATPKLYCVGDVTDLKIKVGNEKLTISWTDPADVTIDGEVVAKWKGTKLVMKQGGYPSNPDDGTLLVNNQTRDTYKTNGYIATGLTNDITYYFALFPYTEDGAVTTSTTNQILGIPKLFKNMVLFNNQAYTNPETSCTYGLDATEMTAGSNSWDEFFGIYPCLFKDGVEVGKLNPNDYSKFEDGTDADITSGDAGDVMICFPRIGLTMTNDSNDLMTIKITDDPNNSDYRYLAHTRGSTIKDKIYIGAYKGYVDSNNKLRSLSGKTPTTRKTMVDFRTYAHNNGNGYEQLTFYAWTLCQAMYLMKYKNRDSQSKIGLGLFSSSETTGSTNTNGMNYGDPSSNTPVKCLGIENLWNIFTIVDGVYISNGTIFTSTSISNSYTNTGIQITYHTNVSGGITKVMGMTEAGFIPKEADGSATTGYCDSTRITPNNNNSYILVGGAIDDIEESGIFSMLVGVHGGNIAKNIVGARLMYL